ncbi:ABC transporter ATP-binding protein [Salinibaculum rarum]|jgi:ABC-type multidrug transport system ATPase subunit|uniref:ABC transporter ATP-binding protein n=1 Tax=Salinibaculum rarum TaxID=3058903 RepID=UPI00265DEDAA|nr:ABC transporter ATP-binding protein [Salinibaculum sp. KK48]
MSSQPTTQQDEPTSEQETVVDIAGLGHSFGDLDVLGDISFSVEAGTVACIIGPNGSGKTTLLRLITGLLDPDTGSVTVADDGDRRVGYLAQQPAFRPQFTVRETIEFYGTLVDVDVDSEAILERVGLSAVADRRVDALSGGMMRLLGIAQTTVGDPSVLVLDEPSSGLDPTMTRHITDIVGALAAEGDAILLATHDLRSVERIADTVFVIDRGELVATGGPEELLAETDTETLEDALETLSRGDDAVTVSAGLHGGESE